MVTRRSILAGLIASGADAKLSWADAGTPTHLSAAMMPSGEYVLAGLRADGTLAFKTALPDRGHAAAAHPFRPEAVVFSRRPGTYALVIDCITGNVLRNFSAPDGLHFYGHGAFSKDGDRLYTTENDIETGEGRIGIWSRSEGFARIGQVGSGGIGPHEVLRLPGTDVLAVANGGILTRPQTGREKLNLDTMRPNLTLMSETGDVLDVAELPHAHHQNSLRHIAAGNNGIIACAFQWQGDLFDAPPLIATYSSGAGLHLLNCNEAQIRALNGYGGSVAILPEDRIALSSPRGGVLQLFDRQNGFLSQFRQDDVCGVSSTEMAGLATDGMGGVHKIQERMLRVARHDLAFDNHLVAI